MSWLHYVGIYMGSGSLVLLIFFRSLIVDGVRQAGKDTYHGVKGITSDGHPIRRRPPIVLKLTALFCFVVVWPVFVVVKLWYFFRNI